MTRNKSLCWLFAMTHLIIGLAACTTHTPTPQAPRDTDEPVRSTVAAVSPVTQPPNTATPIPRNTTTPVLPSPSPTTGQDAALPGLILPDLQTEQPRGLVVQPTLHSHILLRFTNTIVNLGPGTLEVQGRLNAVTNQTAITQFIDSVDGDTLEYAAGEFIFHRGHNHWHMENFVLYEVWSLTATGELDSVVAFTDKVSYCLRDDFSSEIEGIATNRTYTNCTQAVQGISVGWHDVYETFTPGQEVDITDVADGVYALQSTVDPANHLQETDDTNNAAVIYFKLESNRVRVLDRHDALDALRLLLDDQ